MHRRCKSLIGVLCCSLICGSTPMVYASSFNGVASVSSVKEVKVGEETISAPMLATIATLAVASGITLSSDDDIYDIGRLFYDYVERNNDLNWGSVKTTFESAKVLNDTILINRGILDITKGFFDNVFGKTDKDIGFVNGTEGLLPYFSSFDEGVAYLQKVEPFADMKYMYDNAPKTITSFGITLKSEISYGTKYLNIYYNDTFKNQLKQNITYPYGQYLSWIAYDNQVRFLATRDNHLNNVSVASFGLVNANIGSIPYTGSYDWDSNVEDKKEGNGDLSLPIPGDLGDLVGKNPSDIWGSNYEGGLIGKGTITLPTVSNPSIQVDTSVVTFPTDDKSLKTPVTLTQEATILDVVVPLSFPVSVDSEGVVTVADNVEVVNNSNGPIKISDVSIQSKDGWTLSDFDKDYSTERVGSKECSFKIEGQEIRDSITLDRVVNGLDKCSISYDSNISPQKESIVGSNIADVVFTIDWYEN